MTRVVGLDDIRVGQRDRSDLGDIAELAASIDAVGLLHPVVITAGNDLVAGERRLAALAELGWTEVPVTVVDLDTAEVVLRAELDENTCRQPLTPYEASKARERRAAALAPTQPKGGRGKTSTSPSLGDVSDTRTAKVAAMGTGYSGSTLDKVDRIRDAAELGVIRRGKATMPAPEPVQEVARAALAAVSQTGAAVDSAYRKVDEAIAHYTEEDPGVSRARHVKAWLDALFATRRFREFDVTTLDDILNAGEWETSVPIIDEIACQVDAFRTSLNGTVD
ncbi:MAG: ParB N-terminal domain-containing protein [Pseudonocardiaceae bacterium]